MPKTLSADTRHDRRTENLSLRVISLIAIVSLFVAGVSSSVTETEASWDNSEHTVASELVATTISPPTDLECDAPFLIGRPTLEWEHPPDGPPESYVVEVRHNATGNTNQYVIEDGNTTSLRLTDGILSNLLGNLLGLGGDYTARIQASGPAHWQWTSDFSNSAKFYTGLLGALLPRCP